MVRLPAPPPVWLMPIPPLLVMPTMPPTVPIAKSPKLLKLTRPDPVFAAATVATWISGMKTPPMPPLPSMARAVAVMSGVGSKPDWPTVPEAARTTVPVVTTLSKRMLSGRSAASVTLPMVRPAAPSVSNRFTVTVSPAVPWMVSDEAGCAKVVVSKPGVASASRSWELLSARMPLSSSRVSVLPGRLNTRSVTVLPVMSIGSIPVKL